MYIYHCFTLVEASGIDVTLTLHVPHWSQYGFTFRDVFLGYHLPVLLVAAEIELYDDDPEKLRLVWLATYLDKNTWYLHLLWRKRI